LDDGRFGVADEVFGIDGAAPLFRRAMLDDICFEGEYFDESFFAHKEDVDLCWRARWRGWKALYVPRATAIHERSFRPGTRHRVSAETRIHAVKNRYLLLIKNESSVGWRRDGLRILSYDLAILVYMVLLEPRSLLAWPRLMNCLGRARAWRARIQRTRSVDPRSLLVWFELPARSEARPPSSR
jgi:GT2 family glycosyltransferase